MNPSIEAARAVFEASTAGYHEQERVRQHAALQLIAAHARNVAPQATHMLMESCDQGEYLCTPSFLTVGVDHVAEDEWDAHVEEHEDDLGPAASWLPLGSDRAESDGWGQFVDPEHPYTNRRGGHYALDLARIATLP